MTKEDAKKYRVETLMMNRDRLSDEIGISAAIIEFYEEGKTVIPDDYEILLKNVMPNRNPASFPRSQKSRERISEIDNFILGNIGMSVEEMAMKISEKKSYIHGRIAYLRRQGRF